MTDDDGVGVTLYQLLQQPAHFSLLRLGSRVFGLTAYVQTTLVADAYRVFVVVQAVCTYEPFRSSFLPCSVTTDHVVVADAEFESPLPVPRIYLGYRTGLVRTHRTAMNDDKCDVTIEMITWPMAFQNALFFIIV